MLEYGAPYIDQDSTNSRDIALITIAENICEEDAREKFNILIKCGANINVRNHWGDTCLQRVISTANTEDDFEDRLSWITMLIRRGADVDSEDNRGWLITREAYAYNQMDWLFGSGGYRGDLWDAALLSLGFDLLERRNFWPRRPHYTSRYTRQHFERLWAGREDQCPYYHDPPHWPEYRNGPEFRREVSHKSFDWWPDEWIHAKYLDEVHPSEADLVGLRQRDLLGSVSEIVGNDAETDNDDGETHGDDTLDDVYDILDAYQT